MLLDDGFETNDYNNIATSAVSTLENIFDIIRSSKALSKDYLTGKDELPQENKDYV
jgi:hypothetical protein